jgi:diphosphomevalonate decarboxylase
MQAIAQAQPNIALVKYWGKRDSRLNLPAVGSISITLDSLWTRTRVTPDPGLEADAFTLDGQPARPEQSRRASALLDELRARAGRTERMRVDSVNNFPTAAGLASSASGFAALAFAGSHALGLALDAGELSRIARRASGSAARSIFGGFVEMERGRAADGRDACARPLRPAAEWPLEVVIAITSTREKELGSTQGMTHSAATSPYYPVWVQTSDGDLARARAAVAARDFAALAAVSESSCLKMHAVALAADPGIVYWNGGTVEALRRIRALRRAGTAVFFTIDAGPQVKAVCLPDAAPAVAAALQELPAVEKVVRSRLGEGARLLESTVDRALA